MGSEPNRFLHQQQGPGPLCKSWRSCFQGLPCFPKQKGGKRIVPSRIIEGGGNHPELNHLNGPQPIGFPNQTANGLPHSLYAPPSSPVSFSHSAVPSTIQSPNNFLSASPPSGPQSTMFVTGPYAHETQLVSPPVFSTFTTEPSTAPLTPPPELAHLTTPSSPEVPYARFLSSSRKGGLDRKSDDDNYVSTTDLQSTYSLHPGSPAVSLQEPVPMSESGRALKPGQDSNFFCPETFAQFYLDQSSFSQSGGRLSISREADAYSNGGGNRQSKVIRPDAEELEAYRASFGFSADEIITTSQYVEISDVADDSFTLVNNKSEHVLAPSKEGLGKVKAREGFAGPDIGRGSYKAPEDQVPHKRAGDDSGRSLPNIRILNDDDDIFSKMEAPRVGRKSQLGSSNSDCEIEYRRGRSMREW